MSAETTQKQILKALLAGPRTALELIDSGINVGRSGFAIYPALRSMVASKMLSSREEPGGAARGGRPKIIYALTDTGRLAALGES